VTGYLVVLGVAAVVTALTTALAIPVAKRIRWVAYPNERSMHVTPLPNIGGLALLVGFLAAIAVAWRMDQFAEMFRDNSEPMGVVLAGIVITAVGLLDDRVDVSPPAKVAGIVLGASILARLGVTMFFFRVPFNIGNTDTVVLSPDLAPLVTVLWVVLLTNAINLIDGLDGLAAGITAIGGSAFFVFSDRLFDQGFLEGSNIAPLIAIITVGVCAGFLPFNFNPARIIMGDSGALFLGLLLAVPTITVGGRTDFNFSGNTYFFFAPLVIPIVILGVPVLDTAFSFFRRLLRGRRWSLGDRDHIHHRLVRLGHGPRRAVAILWAWTALLSGVALAPTFAEDFGAGGVNLNSLVPFAILALGLVLYIAFHPGARTHRERHRETATRGRHPTAPGASDGAAEPDAAAADEADETAIVVQLDRRRRSS
jgi:UDP-GlcNAc:undecaprenyl-phosphate GlcNAc-1-phosphate transferase